MGGWVNKSLDFDTKEIVRFLTSVSIVSYHDFFVLKLKYNHTVAVSDKKTILFTGSALPICNASD